jgi:DNA-binding transcriptional MerR regulator
MHIGALAAKSGRSIHTIRWYEKQRLMPLVARDSGGRRIYGELHTGWMDLLDRLKKSGMSIRQMREYTALVKRGDSTLADRRELLRAHQAHVEARIAELRDSSEVIAGKIDFYEKWITTGKRPRIEPLLLKTAQKSKTPNKERMRRIFDELAQGNSRLFAETLADDMEFTVIGSTRFSRTFQGKQAVLRDLMAPVFRAMEKAVQVTADRILADGDWVVVQFRGSARTKTGKPYHNTYCWICRFDPASHQIREVTEYLDTELVRTALE